MTTQPCNAWHAVEACLKERFPREVVGFCLQGPVVTRAGKYQMRAIPTLPIAVVESQLDEAVGAHGWTFECHPINQQAGNVIVKGMLSLAGQAPKEALGGIQELAPGETADDDALKRCAARWGVGRYLRTLDLWAVVTSPAPDIWIFAPGEEQRLRDGLPSPADEDEPVAARDVPEERCAGSQACTGESLSSLEHIGGTAQEQSPASPLLTAPLPVVALFPVQQINEGVESVDDAPVVPVTAETELDEELEEEEAEELEVLPAFDPEDFDEEAAQSASAPFLISPQDTSEMAWQAEPGLVVPCEGDEFQQQASAVDGRPADPDKLRKVGWLWDFLRKADVPPLEGLDALGVEALYQQLLQAWEEERQQESMGRTLEHKLSKKYGAVSPGPDGQSSAHAEKVTFERYRYLSLAHHFVNGGPPSKRLASTLSPAGAEAMIDANVHLLAGKAKRLPPDERGALLARLAQTEPMLANEVESVLNALKKG